VKPFSFFLFLFSNFFVTRVSIDSRIFSKILSTNIHIFRKFGDELSQLRD
jgi:hypothetical protein